MSFRAAQVLSVLVGCVAVAAKPHGQGAGLQAGAAQGQDANDAGSAVPAHQKHPVDPRPSAPKRRACS